MKFQRHDLVWFQPAADYSPELNKWLENCLPCVVTRQNQLNQPLLSVALSLSADKSLFSRQSFLIEPSVIYQHSRALPIMRLTEIISHPQLPNLIQALDNLGVEPRLFGSYSWQILTGRDYVQAGSDIDVVVQINSLQQLTQLSVVLIKLEQIIARRIDVELVFAECYTVAWREWQSSAQQLLVKTYYSQELLSRENLLDMILSPEQQQLIFLAREALYAELNCYPKAGLVSFVDSGSHLDMNSDTFLASIDALNSYWYTMLELGANGANFMELVAAGKNAERLMLQATQNINTHRGAIFIMGILLAGIAYAAANKLPFNCVPELIQQLWGQQLLEHQISVESHGKMVRRRYPDLAANIITDAAGGFVSIFETYLPWLRELYLSNSDKAYIELFYRLLSQVNDTNLLYRGGRAGLQFAQKLATEFINAGGVNQIDWFGQAEQIHRQLVMQQLSPGGCADLLAATIFIHSVEQEFWD